MEKTKEEIVSDFEASSKRLFAFLDTVPDGQFNEKPADGGWSPAQTVQHIIKGEVGTHRVFSGGAEPAERDPQKYLGVIQEKMQTSKKIAAPDFMKPDDEPMKKAPMVKKLTAEREQLLHLIKTNDMSEILTDTNHPNFGQLSRAEWIYFTMAHTDRHLGQIERTLDELHK